MSKYIIKNCPCCVDSDYACDCEIINTTYCENCTNCLLKQVVEKCKYVSQNGWYIERKLPNGILQLMNIEEVE